MEIVEDSAQRITLVENGCPIKVIFFVLFCLLSIIFTVVGLGLLFAHLSEILAPQWAEAHHLSGHRWRNEGSDVPASFAVSFAVSLSWLAMSLSFLFVVSNQLLFSTHERIALDFSNGQVTLNRRGLLRCPDRQFPMSEVSAHIKDAEDEGRTYRCLEIIAVPSEERRGWASFLSSGKTLWEHEIRPDQLESLRWLVQRFSIRR